MESSMSEHFNSQSNEYSSSLLALSPVSYWRLNEGTGTTATDSVGGHDGIYRNGVQQGSAGLVAGDAAAAFDGSNDHVEVPLDGNDLQLSAGTVTMLIAADDLSGRQGLWSRDSGGYDNGGHASLWLEGSRVVLRLQDTANSYTLESANGVVEAGKTHQIAFTFGGTGGARLYVDGAEVASSSYTGGLVGNIQPMALGTRAVAADDGVLNRLQEFFDGTIDEVAVYDKVLSLGEIAGLADAIDGEAPPPPPPSNPSLTVSKSADVTAVDEAGDVITYTITIDNDGDVDLTDVVVDDPLLGGNLGAPTSGDNADGILGTDETWIYTATYDVTGTDISTDGGGDGDIDNTVTVTSNQTGAQTASVSVDIVEVPPPPPPPPSGDG